ncbi:uncharacterized protein LOC113526907 [Pangasianodon hypophthalmus]|uniref:uncharacterized protein LOC113526907 n=1 Tax=Pangasianodon hypophthalmus TaxID=310915 RepID=UPI0023078AC5|nr:uncharacterized protein LOC113526907 [Pangasianodon hypophthalmus]
MKPFLIAVFLNILSTSLQEERLGRLRPAYIYSGGVTKVNENENVVFKCKADNIPESTIYMHLFKNGERVRTDAFKATTRDDTIFNFTKVTAELSGLYTCLYSEENLSVKKTNAKGHNSVSIKVLGKIFPAKIERTETSTLTCTFTKIQNCTQVYVYLCLNGIGNRTKQVNCSDMTISTTFLLSSISEKSSGNYSCVYSVSNYSLSEVNNAGENTVFVQAEERNVLSVIISVSVAALVVLLVLLGFCWYRDILCFRLSQDPAVRSPPNSEPFYHEIRAGTLYVDENGVLRSFGGMACGSEVEVSYTTVQKHRDEQPVDKDVELTTEGVCYDSVRVPYAVVQRRKDKTGDEQVMQSFSCATNVTYTEVKY